MTTKTDQKAMQSSLFSSDETKIIYYIDDEETPYLVKLPVGHSSVTLADFKAVLSLPLRPKYKFFFKSLDDDFGVVKEEIIDNSHALPIIKGRVVAWVWPPCRPPLSHTFFN